MDEVRWLMDGARQHAYTPGRTISLCGKGTFPIHPGATAVTVIERCKLCQRVLVTRLTAQQRAESPSTTRWRDIAAKAVMGEIWSYADLENMPAWKEAVDKTAAALDDAFRAGILQASKDSRSGST